MKKSNIEYYKKAVRLAEGASGAISKAKADYEHGCEVAKGLTKLTFWEREAIGAD